MSARNCVTHHYACDCREELHKAEIAKLRRMLGECYVLSGADTDGNPPERMADAAVSAVATLRRDYDDACDELAAKDAEISRLKDAAAMLDWIEIHGNTITLGRSAKYVAISADRESVRRVMGEVKE